jgi:uncharacterized protein
MRKRQGILRYFNYLAIFVLSCMGGWLCALIHFPLPWTLGPLITVILVRAVFKLPVYWPGRLRNVGVVVIGYVMGSPFTPQTGQHILAQLPAIAIMTLLTFGLCMAGGYIVGKYLNLHLSTSIIGSMPGGLSQMAIVCEDIEGSDAAAVTLMQTVRVITTVFVVPFLVLHGMADRVDPVNVMASHFSSNDLPSIALFAGVNALLIYIGKRIKMPSPFLIAPVIGTSVMVLSGVDAPALPPVVVAGAQVFIAIRMGMAVEVSGLTNWKKMMAINFIAVCAIILILLGADYILSLISGIPFVTAFISTSPGGMTEMGLTALMVHADLSTVIAFQLFRLMFVLLLAVPVARWWLCRINKDCIKYCPID